MMQDTELMLDVGQANELKLAFRKAGWKNADIKKLCEGKTAEQVLLIVRSQAELRVIQHLVDCDEAVVPTGYNWTVEFHQKGGQVKLERRGDDLFLNGEKIVLHLVKKQVKGKVIEGHELSKELSGEKVLNANVLDYLLAHPDIIPDSWKQDEEGNARYIFFWGTIYRNSDGHLYVRCLCWGGGQWCWRCGWLRIGWGSGSPAAVLAS